jgi:hypothetical protein
LVPWSGQNALIRRIFQLVEAMKEDLVMEWTPEQDAQLTEMHRKRLSVRFVADWMRWPAAAVRLRLIELGLVKPLTARGSSVVVRTARPATGNGQPRHAATSQAADLDDDDDDDLRAQPGCPRGHLIPEAKIAALYSGTGGDYR